MFIVVCRRSNSSLQLNVTLLDDKSIGDQSLAETICQLRRNGTKYFVGSTSAMLTENLQRMVSSCPNMTSDFAIIAAAAS
jgi:hypothetical protein